MPVLSLPSAYIPHHPQSSPAVPAPLQVQGPEKGTVQFEFLSDSIFAAERPRQECVSYAEAVTHDQLMEYDMWAELEYQSNLDNWRNHVFDRQAERVREGSMDWVMADEGWFLDDAEDMVMDMRR